VVGVDAMGATEGLGILWNPKAVRLEEFRATHFHLSASFHILGTNIRGTVTNIYGPSTTLNKPSFLDSLQWMGSQIGKNHWILGGDFNLIRHLGEKRGGTRHLTPHSLKFGEIIESLHLVDVCTSNGLYTWNNKRFGDRSIAIWLDHFLIS